MDAAGARAASTTRLENVTPEELERNVGALAGKLAFISTANVKNRLVDVECYDAIDRSLLCYFRFDPKTRRGAEPRLAAKVRKGGGKLEPMQLAALLLEKTTEDLGRAEKILGA